MTKFIVDYDKVGDTSIADYEPVYRVLRSLIGKRITLSQWLVEYPGSGEALLQFLIGVLDPNDRIVVLGVETAGIWGHNTLEGDFFGAATPSTNYLSRFLRLPVPKNAALGLSDMLRSTIITG